MTEKTLLDAFVDLVIAKSDYEALDRIYLNNRIMNLVGESVKDVATKATDLIDLKEQLIQGALKNGKVGETFEEQDCLGAELMNFMTPIPSVVNQRFWQTHQADPKKAIADFYQLSKDNDYIKTRAIAKNIYFKTETQYGDIEITINLSKPEKDPKQIALAKKMKASGYPMCLLCLENEGYQGRINHPARANHRVIRFDLLNKTWGFQYSPYAYFNEHCIFLSSQHEPMSICDETFARLLSIIETFPGYFVGSNADLPIVGGSILTHEHYQGGHHEFAMQKAPIEKAFTFTGFEDVSAGIVKWPMSVLRLRSANKASLLALASKLLAAWRAYSDESVQVLASSNGEAHHTITPIARMRDGQFELDLVLRDNQTSAEFPDGIYHPHQDVQHIKKENIGLIEVMGLAILPPRLKDEMQVVADYLLGKVASVAQYHQVWADQIKANHPEVNAANVEEIVHQEIGKVFARVLEDAGVFKRDQKGQAAFMRFVKSVGIND